MSKLQPNNIAKFKQQMKTPAVRLQRTVILKEAQKAHAQDLVFTNIGDEPSLRMQKAYGLFEFAPDYRRFTLRK